MKRVRVGAAADLPPGGVKTVAVDGREVAVFNVDGALRAVDNICPHRGAPLCDGRVERGVVTCPWHGWQFNLETGGLLVNPDSKIDTFKVVRDGDDVFVEV